MKVEGKITYEKVSLLEEQGNNSDVYLIDDCQLGGRFVAKEIQKSEMNNKTQSVDFFVEAKRLHETRHRNIVPINYACDTDSTISLVMPFFTRGSLQRRIQNTPVSCAEAIRIFQGVLNGLAQIHSKGLLHLDIKPSNILFDEYDEPLISDFGLATLLKGKKVAEAPGMYGEIYPPELSNGSEVTIESDIFLAGASLYRTVNGNPFFEDQKCFDDASHHQSIKDGKFPNRNSFMPHVPSRLRKIIVEALHTDPYKRYPSALKMADELAKVEVTNLRQSRRLGNGNRSKTD
jgi:serine/threonine protein kinase